jgi:hypothetical protein
MVRNRGDFEQENPGKRLLISAVFAHSTARIEKLPMKRSVAALSFVFALCAIVALTSPALGQDDESGFKNAVAQATQIIKTKIIPRYETKDGFSVKPLDIKYEDDPAIAKWLDEYGSIWKQLDPVVADAYAGFQRKVNDRNKPEANKYRALLADAFNQAVELRGGGSASVQFNTFAPAHAEWIIAHFGTKSDNVPDEKFVSRLTKDLTVGASPERLEVQSVLAKLKAVERFLNQDEAAFLRAEFLSYFES